MHAVAILKLKGFFRRTIAGIVLQVVDTENISYQRGEASRDQVSDWYSFEAVQHGNTLTVFWRPFTTESDDYSEPNEEIRDLFFSVLPLTIRNIVCIGGAGQTWSFER